MDERRRLGLVVVCFGDAAATLACLESIVADPSRVERRTVVVDNGAGTAERRLDPALLSGRAKYLASPDNPGFGAGALRGVRALEADPGAETGTPFFGYVILNHDVEILPGFLDAAAAALQMEGVGAAAGPIYLGSAEGPLWYAGGGFRVLTGTVTQSRSPQDARRAREVGFLPGAALAVRRQAWDATGGFDPGFFLYHEDLDLCLRLRRAGRRLRFEPGMRSVHRLGAATASASRSALYLEHLSATRLRPHRSLVYRCYLGLIHTPYVLLRALGIRLLDRRDGGQRARALLRGHRRALLGILRSR